MDLDKNQIEVQDIDHLGIIAGIIDEMNLVNIIDELIPNHPLEKVSAGVAIKAMVLNCMGFLTSPFYLFSKFFEGKAVEHLLGEGIKTEYLNESRLGRVLDEIFNYGLTKLFVEIAMSAFNTFNVVLTSGHFDITSLSVEGKYIPKTKPGQNSLEEQTDDDEDLKPISITYGYSRDYRPDLKQFVMGLVTNGAEGIPLMMTVGNGNENDGKHLYRMIKKFTKSWKGERLNFIVMDSAGYTPENLNTDWSSMYWITRVPATIKEAKELLINSDKEAFIECENDNRYKFLEINSSYGKINQRWFIVQSEPRQKSDLEKLEKKIEQEKNNKQREFIQHHKKGFACEADALAAIDMFRPKLKFNEISEFKIIAKPFYRHKGKPKVGEEPQGYIYHPEITLKVSEELVKPYKNQAGCFILATNCLDENMLSPSQAFSLYQEQQGTERGFRFIKDPLFFAASVFLKSTSRIMALAFIMALSLMVYSLGQRKLRMALQEANDSVPNQKGKPTNKPTLRWIFQCFQSVHLVSIDGSKALIKVSQTHLLILKFLGSHCQHYYCLG